ILKEIRYPAVAPAEEPGIVQFQALKELNESPESVAVDYAPMPATPGGERQALVVSVRRELIESLRTMCRAAGLKLLGVTPRPFGTAAAWSRVAGPVPVSGDGLVAVVVLGDSFAEFCVLKKGAVIFAR